MSKGKNIKRDTQTRRTVSPQPLKIFTAAVPFLFGIYYEWGSGIICIILLGILWHCFRCRGEIILPVNPLFLSAVIIPVMYGISSIWAVDSGMALFGMVKFLPLPLFVLAVSQLEQKEKASLLDYVPLSGVMMVLLSAVLSMLPVIDQYFIVNSRLAGFFQYPNTFALYLLIGIIILISGEKWTKSSVVYLVVLIGGILLSGSRTGFILFILTIICYLFLMKGKRIRWVLCGAAVGIVFLAGLYAWLTGDAESVGRYLTTSLSSSTFLGRLLYFKDALPVILRHPLGLGYMGYYFTQGSFQTGVYSIVNIHNELLQFLLDIGWVPTVIFLWAVIRGFIKNGLRDRMIIAVVMLHSMMDFNLQFISVFLILLAALDVPEEKAGKKALGKKILILWAGLVGGVSIWLGADSALYYLKMYPQSVSLYPGNTNAWQQLLVEAESTTEMEELADTILALNPQNALANNAKARAAYSEGDFGAVIEYKEKALVYYRYNLTEYLDYFNMLYVGYQLYLQNGDPGSAEICAGKMRGIPERLEEVEEETDPLAYRINDKPELELPTEYWGVLESLE